MNLKSKPLWVFSPRASEPCGSRLQPLLSLWSRQSSVCGRHLSASSLASHSLLPSATLSPPCGARSPSLPLCTEQTMPAPTSHTEGLRKEFLQEKSACPTIIGTLFYQGWRSKEKNSGNEHYSIKYNTWVGYICTFFYELPPALPPFCELLGVGLLNTCPLMNAVHQIIAESVAIIYPFHCSLVITNLRTATETHEESFKGDWK